MSKTINIMHTTHSWTCGEPQCCVFSSLTTCIEYNGKSYIYKGEEYDEEKHLLQFFREVLGYEINIETDFIDED